MYYKNNNNISIIGWLTLLFLLLNPLSASTALETSQLICTPNQLTDFFMRATLALNGLNNRQTKPNPTNINYRGVFRALSNISDWVVFLRNLQLSRFWINLWFMTEDRRFYCIWNKNSTQIAKKIAHNTIKAAIKK